MRILVTDSDTRSALAVVRALGRAGHEVFTAGTRSPSLASASRFSRGHDEYPDPAVDEQAFVVRLSDIVARRRIELVIPTTEVATLLVTKIAAGLPAGCRVPCADHGTIRDASDKALVIDRARGLGIPVPRGACARSRAEAIEIAPGLGWPLVVKPSRSRVQTATRWVSTSVGYAEGPEALVRQLDILPAEAYPVLLQERIEGPGAGVFACYHDGRPVALFSHRRIREKPPSGGVSVLSESAPLDPVAQSHATRLLASFHWQGIAMVEFKRDLRDGSLRLMEINARFWGSLQLAISAGVNFPAILVDCAVGAPPSEPPAYRTGVRSRWLAGDADALLMQLTRSRARLSLPVSAPGRLRSLWNFVACSGAGTHLEIEQWDDLGPARLEWSRRLPGGRQ